MATITSQATPSTQTIWRNGITAAAVAAGVNALLYFVGSALGGFPADVLTPSGLPVTVAPVVIMSAVLILIGTAVYWLLCRFVANPNRWFTIVAVLVLVVMAYGPFTLPNAPTLMIVLLEIMHLVAGGTAIYCLTQETPSQPMSA